MAQVSSLDFLKKTCACGLRNSTLATFGSQDTLVAVHKGTNMLKGRRVVILCEGDTEELAVKHFILRQWSAKSFHTVGIQTINLYGKLQHVASKTKLFLENREVLAVFTMVDLAGMDQVRHSSDDNLEAKVRRVKEWLGNKLAHPRKSDFFPYVCVHETEAWILAEGISLGKRLGDPNIKPDPQAEDKNFQNPPSKRLNTLFLNRRKKRYHKIQDGRPLFANMNFDRVYSSCGYFREFYDNLKRKVAG